MWSDRRYLLYPPTNRLTVTVNITSVDWSSLPPELVEAISRKLTILADYIRFRAVCGAWRSSTLPIPKHLPCQFPWMICTQNGDDRSYRRAFFDIVNNKIHHLKLPELSHQNHRRRLCGSSHGWLAILEDSPCIFLFNPIIRESIINLPPLSSFPNVASFDFARVGREYLIRRPDSDDVYFTSTRRMPDSFIDKILLSGSPGSSTFVAVAVIREMNVLAFCKRGDNCWKYIDETRSFTKDVAYLNGLFYALASNWDIAVCDLSGDSPVVGFIFTPELTLRAHTQYLMNSMGELLLVTRFSDFAQLLMDHVPSNSNKPSNYRLFKLDFAQEKWEEMTGLGNMVLFLGNISSIAIKASDFPGLKGKNIYFSGDYFDAYNHVAHMDVGVFKMDECSFDQLPYFSSESCPVWITPNPC